MLVLSRKQGEQIVIGDNVQLVVISVQGGRVKLGFQAPGDVAIHREEVYQRIRKEPGESAERLTSRGRRVSAAVA